MRRSIEACVVLAAASLAVGPSRAYAQDAVVETAAPSAPPPLERSPVRAEAGGGWDTPLGTASVAFVFRVAPWLSLGAGAGFISEAGSTNGRYALFARAPLFRVGRFTVGPVATASLGNRASEGHYQRPQYAADTLRWSWSHAARLDLGVGAETTFGSLTARLEAGLGYVTGNPTCTYMRTPPNGIAFEGPTIAPCDSAMIPAYYHFSREPGRVTPYVGLSIGYERAAPPAAETAPGSARDDDPRASVAWAAPTALTAPPKIATATLTVPFAGALLGGTVGLPAGFEITAAAGRTFVDRSPFLWKAMLKASVLSSGRFHLALAGGGLGLERGDSYARVLGAGPIASFCFDDGCRSLVSASVFAGAGQHKGDDTHGESDLGVLASASAVVAVARHLKLVGELHVLSAEPRDQLWILAARVPLDRFAVDVGVALGVPIGSLSWRF